MRSLASALSCMSLATEEYGCDTMRDLSLLQMILFRSPCRGLQKWLMKNSSSRRLCDMGQGTPLVLTLLYLLWSSLILQQIRMYCTRTLLDTADFLTTKINQI